MAHISGYVLNKTIGGGKSKCDNCLKAFLVSEEGDEQEETVFIDNLPNDEIAIKAMLVQVAKHIAQLEKRFFEEENSDVDEEDKNDDPS